MYGMWKVNGADTLASVIISEVSRDTLKTELIEILPFSFSMFLRHGTFHVAGTALSILHALSVLRW